MQVRTKPSPPIAPVEHENADAPPRSRSPRTGLRRRHLEAHTVAWLRSLRDTERVRPASVRAGRTR